MVGGNCGPVTVFRIKTQTYVRVPGTQNGCWRGVTGDENYLWAANNSPCGFSQIDLASRTLIEELEHQPLQHGDRLQHRHREEGLAGQPGRLRLEVRPGGRARHEEDRRGRQPLRLLGHDRRPGAQHPPAVSGHPRALARAPAERDPLVRGRFAAASRAHVTHRQVPRQRGLRSGPPPRSPRPVAVTASPAAPRSGDASASPPAPSATSSTSSIASSSARAPRRTSG